MGEIRRSLVAVISFAGGAPWRDDQGPLRQERLQAGWPKKLSIVDCMRHRHYSQCDHENHFVMEKRLTRNTVAQETGLPANPARFKAVDALRRLEEMFCPTYWGT